MGVFQWFANGLFSIAGGEKDWNILSLDRMQQRSIQATNPSSTIFQKIKTKYPDAKTIEVHTPETKASVVGANANPADETYWKLDYRYYD